MPSARRRVDLLEGNVFDCHNVWSLRDEPLAQRRATTVRTAAGSTSRSLGSHGSATRGMWADWYRKSYESAKNHADFQASRRYHRGSESQNPKGKLLLERFGPGRSARAELTARGQALAA